jgi:hypothetical protein
MYLPLPRKREVCGGVSSIAWFNVLNHWLFFFHARLALDVDKDGHESLIPPILHDEKVVGGSELGIASRRCMGERRFTMAGSKCILIEPCLPFVCTSRSELHR